MPSCTNTECNSHTHQLQSQLTELCHEINILKSSLNNELKSIRSTLYEQFQSFEDKLITHITKQLQSNTIQPNSTVPMVVNNTTAADNDSHSSTDDELTHCPVHQPYWGADEFIDGDCIDDDDVDTHHTGVQALHQHIEYVLPQQKSHKNDSNHSTTNQSQQNNNNTNIDTQSYNSVYCMPSGATIDTATLASYIGITSDQPNNTLLMTQDKLVWLAVKILLEQGSVPVGKMGSLLHRAAHDHTLPTMLKERYGGLKKFLQSHTVFFILNNDHPYNPHVTLSQQLATQLKSYQQQHFAKVHGITLNLNTDTNTDSNTSNTTNSHPQQNNTIHANTINMNKYSNLSRTTLDQQRIANQHRRFILQQVNTTQSPPTQSLSISSITSVQLTDVLAIDCEFCGVGMNGIRSQLARCSIVNYNGDIIYDVYVRPVEPVVDYRTHVSGIRGSDLIGTHVIDYSIVQQHVRTLIYNRILVAHNISCDLQVLGIYTHPRILIRDTAYYKHFCPQRAISLKQLVHEHLHWHTFQLAEHDSIQDARAALELYKLLEDEWEYELYHELQQQPSIQAEAARIMSQCEKSSRALTVTDDNDESDCKIIEAAHNNYNVHSAPT